MVNQELMSKVDFLGMSGDKSMKHLDSQLRTYCKAKGLDYYNEDGCIGICGDISMPAFVDIRMIARSHDIPPSNVERSDFGVDIYIG